MTSLQKVLFEEVHRTLFGISDDEVKAFEESLADEYENDLQTTVLSFELLAQRHSLFQLPASVANPRLVSR